MARRAADRRVHVASPKGPAPVAGAAAALRRDQGRTQREVLARLAVFLAQVEGADSVMPAHMAAAAEIVQGNAVADAPNWTTPEQDAAESVPTPALALGRISRRTAAVIGAGCIASAGLALALLCRPAGQVAPPAPKHDAAQEMVVGGAPPPPHAPP